MNGLTTGAGIGGGANAIGRIVGGCDMYPMPGTYMYGVGGNRT